VKGNYSRVVITLPPPYTQNHSGCVRGIWHEFQIWEWVKFKIHIMLSCDWSTVNKTSVTVKLLDLNLGNWWLKSQLHYCLPFFKFLMILSLATCLLHIMHAPSHTMRVTSSFEIALLNNLWIMLKYTEFWISASVFLKFYHEETMLSGNSLTMIFLNFE
jgi:hypothetical protein